ncbi:MAG: ERAP1-like C-terminal domain-containing protein, partial [Actinomycetota bacterium]|nr:ERAP1-like C-terminal domain-containing protein [Actinomycetota bacterium]
LAWIRGLLDGDVQVPGLAVDTELRWHIVGALAAAGAADEDLIAAELERDPTDIGARRAAAARASRPTREAKAQTWTALLSDRSLPLATMRALAAGFARPGQDALLADYVDRYVEALGTIWAERDAEEALLLTDGLYPSTLIDQRTVQAADRALTVPGVPAHGRRLVVEARDATLRALRARAVDAD